MMMRKWSGLFATAAVLTVVACGGGDAAEEAAPETVPEETTTPPPVAANVELPEGVTPEMVAAGRTQFESGTCWTCHGMDGAGGPLAPNLRDDTWLNTDGTYEGIMNIVRTGVAQPKEHPGAMPAMGGGQLTDQQVAEVAAYVYAISHGG